MNAIYGIPLVVYWTVAAIAFVLGLAMVLAGDRYFTCMRRWLLRQLRWIRTPGYRRFMRLNGWALLVLGAILLAMLALMPAL